MEIIRSIQQLEALREDWNALADKLQSPLLRHEWFLSCAKTFQADGSLRVCVIRNNGRLVAAAPLAAMSAWGLERWEFLGVSLLYEPCGFLYDNPASLDALVYSLVAQRIPLLLQRLESDSAVVRAITNLPISKGLIVRRRSSPTLSFLLPATWNEFLAARSANFRYDLKRKHARAKARGDLSVECLPVEPGNLDECMTTLMEVEGSGWKGIRGSSLRHNELLGRFFMNYSRLAAAEGMLRIAFLRIDDKVIAVQLGIEAYGRVWVLKMGYDEAHSHISPGFLLMAGVGRDAIERNLISYEFLGSAEPWEKRWGAQCRDYLTALVYPPTIFGAMAIMMDGISVIRRRTALRLRHLWGNRN